MVRVIETRPQDCERLIPLYREFLGSIGMTMSDLDIIKSLAFMTSNKGLLIHAETDDIPIAFGGGVFDDDSFIGEVAYIKPEFRHKLFILIRVIIKRIKSQAKYWDVICDPVRFNMWNKIGLKPYKLWLRRELC